MPPTPLAEAAGGGENVRTEVGELVERVDGAVPARPRDRAMHRGVVRMEEPTGFRESEDVCEVGADHAVAHDDHASTGMCTDDLVDGRHDERTGIDVQMASMRSPAR